MGIFSGVGGLLNDITGATSAAQMSNGFATRANAMQFLYNQRLQEQNIKWQREVMQNAHQWEAQDLMKSGYNPALTTGLGGASTGGASAAASAGGAGGGTATAGSGAGILEGIGAIVSMKNATSSTKAQNKALKAQAALDTAKALQQLQESDVFKKLGEKEKMAMINNLLANTKYTNERSRGFSETISTSSSKDKGWNLGGKAGGKAGKIAGGSIGGNVGKSNSSSHSYTKSRTW